MTSRLVAFGVLAFVACGTPVIEPDAGSGGGGGGGVTGGGGSSATGGGGSSATGGGGGSSATGGGGAATGGGGSATGGGGGSATGGGGGSATGGGGGSATDGGGIVTPPRRFVLTGSGNGTIRVFRFNETDGGLALLGSTNGGSGSSFLATDVAHSRLYAVNEGSAQIAAFTFDPTDAGLTFLNRVSSGGNGPAHVSVDQSGTLVFAANYSAGSVAVLPVIDAGLAPPSQVENAGGQAHQIFSDPTNRIVYVPCKDDDHIAQYALDGGALQALSPRTVTTANGAGPRHLTLHPTLARAYLINELNSTVQTLTIDAQGRLTSTQTLSSRDAGTMGGNTGAEIAVHPNGRFVYASNRGDDTIARFSVDATSGQLTLLGQTSTEGDTPRHFSIDSSGRWMAVANQTSGTVILFSIDPTTGALTSLGLAANAPGVAYSGFVDLP